MYLPNSIERCTTIVGYDPYAFIMDRPSNLKIRKMKSPYDTGIDYFSKEPAPGSKEETQNNIKKSKIVKLLKIGGAILAAAALFVGIKNQKHTAGTGNATKEGFFAKAKDFMNNKLESFKSHFKKESSANEAENTNKEGFFKKAKNFMDNKIESIKNHFKKEPQNNNTNTDETIDFDIDDFLDD